jgi:Protein of unknown function (DUF1571)
MSAIPLGRSAVLTLVLLTGCGTVGPRPAVVKGPAGRPGSTKQVVVGPNSTREPALADPSTMIPPPPNMDLVPAIPDAPGSEQFVSAPESSVERAGGLVPASGIVRPAVERARGVAGDAVRVAAASAPESNIESIRRLYGQAVERFRSLDGFDCRLTRMETVNNKPMPREELQYRFRREPYSVHITWVGLEAQGRELSYVEGKHDNKVQILTGKHEGLFVPSGKRMSFAPTDSSVRSKSRHDIREGGMTMSLTWFGKVLDIMEQDPSQATRLRYLGRKPVRERESGLEAVEETIPPGWEPLLPGGGKRTTHFDPDPASPSFGLPILVTTIADNGRQVEYYWFDQLRPTRPTDTDFDPDQVWRRGR